MMRGQKDLIPGLLNPGRTLEALAEAMSRLTRETLELA